MAVNHDDDDATVMDMGGPPKGAPVSKPRVDLADAGTVVNTSVETVATTVEPAVVAAARAALRGPGPSDSTTVDSTGISVVPTTVNPGTPSSAAPTKVEAPRAAPAQAPAKMETPKARASAASGRQRPKVELDPENSIVDRLRAAAKRAKARREERRRTSTSVGVPMPKTNMLVLGGVAFVLCYVLFKVVMFVGPELIWDAAPESKKAAGKTLKDTVSPW